MEPLRQPDPRSRIDQILQSFPTDAREGCELTEKVEQISTLLKENPVLKNDDSLMDRVFTAIDAVEDEAIQEMCRMLILREAPRSLKIPEHDLKNYGEGLWDKIAEEGTKKLVIEREGESIVYEERVLRQLAEKRPQIKTLAEMYTLKFEDGKELKETKANLLLCGSYFEDLLLFQEMMEATERVIDFSENGVQFDAFKDLLSEAKTGEREMDDEVYEVVCGFLGYSKWRNYPEGAFGPEEYEYHFGIKVKDVPSVPKEYLEILKGPCPIFEGKQASETHMLYLVVEDWDLETVEKYAKNPVNGNKTEKGFDYFDLKIRKIHGKEKAGKTYWVLKTKELLPNSRGLGKTYQDHMNKAAEYGRVAPTILEEAIGEVTWYVRTEERLMSQDEKGAWIYSCCINPTVYKNFVMVVGGFGPAGPDVDLSFGCGSYDVGVAGVVPRK